MSPMMWNVALCLFLCLNSSPSFCESWQVPSEENGHYIHTNGKGHHNQTPTAKSSKRIRTWGGRGGGCEGERSRKGGGRRDTETFSAVEKCFVAVSQNMLLIRDSANKEIETVDNLKLHNCFEENMLQIEKMCQKKVIPANFCTDAVIHFHVLVERWGAVFCLIF